jgi:hypothetical protein
MAGSGATGTGIGRSRLRPRGARRAAARRAASSNNGTVTTLMFGPSTTDVAAAPHGLSEAPALDHSMTLTHLSGPS